MFSRLAYYYRRLPHYLGHRASPMLGALTTPWHYFQCIPRHQDAPVIIYTMGKVGTITLHTSLLNAGVYFLKETHHFQPSKRRYPYPSTLQRSIHRGRTMERRLFYPWLFRRPRVRCVTMVREPLGRLISIYLYTAQWRLGPALGNASLDELITNFPRVFDHDYAHLLVPNLFFSSEIKPHLGIDIYRHASPRDTGSITIKQGRFNLLMMKLEMPDGQKAKALTDWMGRSISITRRNTAKEAGYDDLYSEFKRRVRIPYRYAEAMYRSSYMHHFYTPAERARFWKRWEPQLDHSIPLPAWIEKQLQTYHPPITPLPD